MNQLNKNNTKLRFPISPGCDLKTISRLLKNEDVPAIEDETTPLLITHEVDLPSDDTSYWCSTHKLPRQFRAKKHHTIMVGTHSYIAKLGRAGDRFGD